ncbi:MAG: hypothetical protein ACE5Q6_15410 [Dehalococcoidia bacterium]
MIRHAPISIDLRAVRQALAVIDVSKLTALAEMRAIYAKQIADVVDHQRKIQSLTMPLLQSQIDYARLLSQIDFSGLLVADQVLGRLGPQISALNRDLIRQVTFPAMEAVQKMLSGFAPDAQMIAQFQSQIARIAEVINQSLWRSFEPLRELAERVGQSQAVCDAFLDYGLWLAPSMPEELVQRVVTLHVQGASSGTVHSVVSRYYAKDDWKLLDRVLDACHDSPLLAPRSDSIRQALQAHREGLYAVVVPALLVQVEGIAADCVKANHLLPKIGSKTTEIIVAALEETPCSLLDVRTYAGVTALLAYIQNSMYISVDFDKDHRRLQREKRLVAHAIRHGRQISYGSRANSLRLFLMIDVLSLLG